MSVLEKLTDEEKYLIAILEDESGVDQAEFLWTDDTRDDGVFRCYDYQVAWYRSQDKFQIDQCVAGGQFVLARDGWTPIELLKVGDEVWTHRGRWRRVTATFDQGERDVVRVAGYGNQAGLVVTSDHKLWARDVRRGSYHVRQWGDADWAEVQNFKLRPEVEIATHWASPGVRGGEGRAPGLEDVARCHNLPDLGHPSWFWLYGLYLAEGSLSSSYGRDGTLNRTTFSVHPDEAPDVRQRLEDVGLRYREYTGTALCFIVESKPLAQWYAAHGGKGAESKQLATWVYDLEEKERQLVLDGLLYGDGHFRPDGKSAEYTTVSRPLAHGVRMLASSLGIPASVTRARAAGPMTIQGRTVQTRECYSVSVATAVREQTRVHFLDDGLGWSAVGSVTHVGRARVYDIEVEEDHSFVVEGVVVSNCARAVGKSVGIQLRAFAFGFNYPGEEMLLTAPELIHLDPVTRYIEDRLLAVRLSREMLASDSKTSGIRHRPFEVKYKNGSKIVGRIPQKDGKGIKGMHPKKLEMDEAQDYPEQGWIELTETLKYGQAGSSWRAHGVTRGVRDYFYKLTQPESGWAVHRITAMHRPDWTEQERRQKAEVYGGRHAPDYRRNILGQHGDAQNPLFVLTRLMACVDSNQGSTYNTNEYLHMRITHERVVERGGDIGVLLEFPVIHRAYERTWVGMDVGMTNHPSEILIFGEVARKNSGKAFVKGDMADPDVKLKCLARIHLERISAPDQRAVLKAIYDHYKPRAMAMDKTGLGLPIYQEVINGKEKGMAHAMRGYNFSEKIVVGYEEMPEDIAVQDVDDYAILANVLEYSSDTLRLLVDRQQLILPWDVEMLREFQGQTYVVKRSQTNPYGKKQFNQGKFHTLDAARMAALAFSQEVIEATRPRPEEFEPVLDAFVM